MAPVLFIFTKPSIPNEEGNSFPNHTQYSGIAIAVARALGITMDADTLNGVALIERTQLELWNREKH